jgi:predicted nuclease of predicted toxin-antitoxin system
VRVLLDENLPLALGPCLTGHEIVTVRGLGWTGLKNGALLQAAHGQADAFVTMDANLEFQQRLTGLQFGVVVIHARSNRIADLQPLVPLVLAALNDVGPGRVRHIGA